MIDHAQRFSYRRWPIIFSVLYVGLVGWYAQIVFVFDRAIPNHHLLSSPGAAPQTDTRYAMHQIDNVLTTDLTCRACYVSLHTYCTYSVHSKVYRSTREHP